MRRRAKFGTSSTHLLAGRTEEDMKDRMLFGGWQTRVIHERGDFSRILPRPYSYRVGASGAKKIAMKLAEEFGDGTYRFIRYVAESNRTKSAFGKPGCREICRVKVKGGVVVTC
jgi:hypothetical protein